MTDDEKKATGRQAGRVLLYIAGQGNQLQERNRGVWSRALSGPRCSICVLHYSVWKVFYTAGTGNRDGSYSNSRPIHGGGRPHPPCRVLVTSLIHQCRLQVDGMGEVSDTSACLCWRYTPSCHIRRISNGFIGENAHGSHTHARRAVLDAAGRLR
ncbi:hypothetical protein BJX96DRAFT_143151 [Aspergillus floccosus]